MTNARVIGVDDIGPIFEEDGATPSVAGMTLRDWFAGQALAGLATGCDLEITGPETAHGAAAQAYAFADAMLAQREKAAAPAEPEIEF